MTRRDLWKGSDGRHHWTHEGRPAWTCYCGAPVYWQAPGADVDCRACGQPFNSGGQPLANDAPVCGRNGFGPSVEDEG